MFRSFLLVLFQTLVLAGLTAQPAGKVLQPIDVFDIEYVSEPQVSPAGDRIVFVRNFKDIMSDGNRSNLWWTSPDGAEQQPLTSGMHRDFSPRFSPDGTRLAYLSDRSGSVQVYLRWLETGAETRLSNLTQSPSDLQWSPDGQWLSFTMPVPYQVEPLVRLPAKPEGATWTERPVVVDKLRFRADGAGFLKDTYTHLFLLPAAGGSARQLTSGNFNHNGGHSWHPDGKTIVFSANRHDNWEHEPANTEIYELQLADLRIRALTQRAGPDNDPVYAPDGRQIAFTGYDERYQGYQVTRLYVMDSQGGAPRELGAALDRDIENIQWTNEEGIYFQCDSYGHTRIALMSLEGNWEDLAGNVGGLSLGRPYGGGAFHVNARGQFAFTHSTPDHPADLAVGRKGAPSRRLTNLNADLFAERTLGTVEEIRYRSAFDDREIQGWICKPPGFDPAKKYPLILEIHGGPFSNYGDRFSLEVQLYAAAGYVVLYTNPRGSTSYGAEFGNLIHHNYPGEDYDDLMSGVDAVIGRGYIDENRLFVTGGSGGGVLTAWIISKTNRFRAAVVAKPVINWYSFVLHADNPAFFYRYWFPGYPWEHQEHYMARSPISRVGYVETPTMLLTGEKDYRTPMSETEQYYAALRLRQVPTVLVRIQEAGHGIVARPSNLINKVSYILGWFERYDQP